MHFVRISCANLSVLGTHIYSFPFTLSMGRRSRWRRAAVESLFASFTGGKYVSGGEQQGPPLDAAFYLWR